MNASMFSTLLVIASAPVIDAPLSITVTAKGRQTLAAHNAPVPRVRRRQATTPTTVCGLCGRPVTGGEDCPCDDGICLEVTSSLPAEDGQRDGPTRERDCAPRLPVPPGARVWSPEELTALETEIRDIAYEAATQHPDKYPTLADRLAESLKDDSSL